MTRLIHIEQWFHPEYGYQVQQFIPLHSPEFEIIVLTSPFVNKSSGETPESLRQKDAAFMTRTGCRIIRLPVLWQWRGKMWFRRLAKTVRDLKPDAVFCHGVEFLPLVQMLLSGVSRSIPLVTDCHDLPTVIRSKLLYGAYKLLLKHYVAPGINAQQVPTYYLTEQTKVMLEDYGISASLLKFLPLGVDVAVFHPDSADRDRMRAELGLTADELLILYTGKLDAVKSPHLLRDAFRKLPEHVRRKCRLMFVGAADAEYAANHGFSGTDSEIILRGAVPYRQLASYYRAADIGCFPAQNTLSSLEAQACGLPLVMQDDPINRERLVSGGLVFPPYDTEKLADVLTGLLQDPDLRRRLSNGGASHMRATYDYQSIVRQLESDILTMVRSRRQSLEGEEPPSPKE